MYLDDGLRDLRDYAVPAQHCNRCLDDVIFQHLFFDRFAIAVRLPALSGKTGIIVMDIARLARSADADHSVLTVSADEFPRKDIVKNFLLAPGRVFIFFMDSVHLCPQLLCNDCRKDLVVVFSPMCDDARVAFVMQNLIDKLFTLAEQKQIEQAVMNGKKDKLYGILLCLYSGLRIGELIALQWSDIDFAKGILTVSKSCYDSKDGLIIDEPKTATSRRVIPLPKQLMPLLKSVKKKSDSPFVVSANGKPVSVRSYQRSFELLLKRLDIPHKGFHSLRHTFATRALECGMDVKTLSEILGHKNPTVTLNRYAHSLMEHKADMMNRLGKILTPKSK